MTNTSAAMSFAGSWQKLFLSHDIVLHLDPAKQQDCKITRPKYARFSKAPQRHFYLHWSDMHGTQHSSRHIHHITSRPTTVKCESALIHNIYLFTHHCLEAVQNYLQHVQMIIK